MTSAAISSVALISGTTVVASGPSSPQIAQIDFSSPTPVVTMYAPGNLNAPDIDADPNANTMAAGDFVGFQVELLNATTHAVTGGPKTTTFGGNTSVAISGSLILIGSSNDPRLARVNFSNATPVTIFDPAYGAPSMGSGSTVAIDQMTGACGAILAMGTGNVTCPAKLFDLTPATPVAIGVQADSQLHSISTIGISHFTPPTVSITPTSLDFGPVLVGNTASSPLTIKNLGTVPLTLSQLKLQTGAPFAFTVGGNQLPANATLTLGPQGSPTATVVIDITFKPTSEAPFTDSFQLKTTDPAHATVNVTISGLGARAHISVNATSFDFGDVHLCQNGTHPFNITNTGDLPLHVTGITSSAPEFSASPTTLTVVKSMPQTFTAKLTPSMAGPANATLTIASDAFQTPKLAINLTGNGLPMQPPTISVTSSYFPPNTKSLNFGLTPVQFFFGLQITVSNTAPCQDLSVTLSTNGAPFFVTVGNPTSAPTTATPLSDTVPKSSSKNYVVVFAPTAVAAVNGTLTITSDDPNTPSVSVSLSGTGVLENPIALELVLDRSGSMSGAAPGGTKMDALHAAVATFADVVVPGHGDAMGSVAFDDQFNVLTPFADYSATQQQTVKNDAASLTPRNATSIGGGLQLGESEIASSTLARKVIVVFTDGMENTPPMISTVSPAILAANTEIYAVGLGQPQNISTAALGQLAVSANGKLFQTDDTLVLRKQFVQVLADAYRMNMAADPIFTVSQGRTVDQTVEITRCDRRITFILHWDNPGSQVGMQVVAPDGTVFTQSTPAVNRLVRFGAAPGYSFCQIAFPPIGSTGQIIGPQQVGTWHMLITGTSLVHGSERCATNVMADSDLTISATATARNTSSPLTVSVQILDAGVPVSNAELSLKITAPTKSLASVLTPRVITAAKNADTRPFPAGGRPLIPARVVSLRLSYNSRTGKFAVRLPASLIDGVYQFEVVAKGQGCGGKFERYATFSQYIGPKPSASRTTVTVTPVVPVGVIVTVTPHTSANAPLGPGLASLIVPVVKNAMMSAVVDQGDGTYAFRIFWNGKRAKPTLTIKIGEEEKTVRLSKSTPKPPSSRK